MNATTLLSFATLIFSCIACGIIGIGLLSLAIFWRRLNKQMRRDRLTEYKPRKCPSFLVEERK